MRKHRIRATTPAIEGVRCCIDCGVDLTGRQQMRCLQCRKLYNQRERRRRVLEQQCFGRQVDIDPIVLSVISDPDDLAELRATVARREEEIDDEIVYYCGTLCRRDVRDCFEDDKRRFAHFGKSA